MAARPFILVLGEDELRAALAREPDLDVFPVSYQKWGDFLVAAERNEVPTDVPNSVVLVADTLVIDRGADFNAVVHTLRNLVVAVCWRTDPFEASQFGPTVVPPVSTASLKEAIARRTSIQLSPGDESPIHVPILQETAPSGVKAQEDRGGAGAEATLASVLGKVAQTSRPIEPLDELGSSGQSGRFDPTQRRDRRSEPDLPRVLDPPSPGALHEESPFDATGSLLPEDDDDDDPIERLARQVSQMAAPPSYPPEWRAKDSTRSDTPEPPPEWSDQGAPAFRRSSRPRNERRAEQLRPKGLKERGAERVGPFEETLDDVSPPRIRRERTVAVDDLAGGLGAPSRGPLGAPDGPRPAGQISTISRVIAVWSSKGGVGKTAFAVNLAAYVAASRLRVLLVDLDVDSGDVGIRLGIRSGSTKTVTDLLQDSRALTPDHLVEALPVSESTSVSLLLAPNDVLAGVHVADSAGAYQRVIDVARRAFGLVVLDCPAGAAHTLVRRTAFTSAEKLLLVCDNEPAALVNLLRSLSTILRDQTITLNPKDCALVVNQYVPGGVPLSSIQTRFAELGVDVVYSVPDRRQAVLMEHRRGHIGVFDQGEGGEIWRSAIHSVLERLLPDVAATVDTVAGESPYLPSGTRRRSTQGFGTILKKLFGR